MQHTAVKKSENALKRIIYCEVYAPNIPDSGGDFATAEEIEKAAHNFLRLGRTDQVDLQHDNELFKDSTIVESFIARDDDSIFIPGAWVVGIHIPSDEGWAMVEAGEINGVSMEALAMATDVDVTVQMPNVITGRTDLNEGHDHTFSVKFDDEFNMIGGRTSSAPDGHFHEITLGTVTDDAEGHNHRFACVDDVQITEVS